MNDLLDGLRVLDLGRNAAGPYCTKLLADAGADVVHIEHPDGDPGRGSERDGTATETFSPSFAFLNAGKRSAVLDYETERGAALLWRLIDWADLLVEDMAAGALDFHGFGPDAVAARNQSLVYVSISNFGQTGPNRNWKATELTVQAAAGLSHGNGAEDREPLRYPGDLAAYWAAANAAFGAVAAFRYSRSTGRGQHVDVSIQESLASTFFLLWADYQYQGVIQQRGQKELLPAADGWIYPRWQPSVPWDLYAIAFDAPELSVDPDLQPPLGMTVNAERFAEVLGSHTKLRTRREWIDIAIEHGIPIGFLQSPAELLDCPQLAAREFFGTVAGPGGEDVPFPGPPYIVDGVREPSSYHVPALGEHNAEIEAGLDSSPARSTSRRRPPNGIGALASVRVLDNGIVQAGTFPARLFADLGAETVRVENYRSPDGTRNSIMPGGEAGEQYWDQGGVFHEQHRNKAYSLGLDVKDPKGREAFLRTVEHCDIVLDSHPPGVLERLGLGYEDLKALKPDIVFVTTSGYGVGGPYSDIRSYGMMTELAAISSFNGYEGDEPRRGGPPLTDHPAAYHIAFLMLAALERRDRTGQGCRLDVSQYEIGVNLLGDRYLAEAAGMSGPYRTGNRESGSLLSGCYPSAGRDRWVTVSVADQVELSALCELVGNKTPAPESAQNDKGLAQAVAAWTSGRSAASAAAELQAAGISAAPVNTVRDLLLDDHLRERDFFWLVEHGPGQERVGKRAFPGAPFKMSETPPELRRHAPLLGEHNQTLATGLLGYNDDEFAAMREAGVFGTVPLAAAVVPPKQDIPGRLALSAWVYLLRAGEVDPDFLATLRSRFGPEFASAN